MSESELYCDDDTVSLVIGAMVESGLSGTQAWTAFQTMQDVGILFRERDQNILRSRLIKIGKENS